MNDILIDFAIIVMAAAVVGIGWDMYKTYQERQEDDSEPHDPYNDIKEF